jgi:two-component system, chemotaxis family, sensor kinase CheA
MVKVEYRSMSSPNDDMIRGFIQESTESFDLIENDLIAIESDPENLNIINRIFRVMHTIKGTAGFLKLDDIGKLAHRIESIFDKVRREELTITPEKMDQLLPAIDLLKKMVFELTGEERSEYQLDQAFEDLQRLIYPNASVESPSAVAGEQSEVPAAGAVPTGVDPDVAAVEAFKTAASAITPEIRDDFVFEVEEHFSTIESNLLVLEKNPTDIDAVDEVFRAIHSVKGTADYVSLSSITGLSHRIETIFDQIRKRQRTYTDELADTILKAFDALQTLVALLKPDAANKTVTIGQVCRDLDRYLAVPAGSTSQPEATAQNGATEGLRNAFRRIGEQQIKVIRGLGEGFTRQDLTDTELSSLQRSIRTLKNIANNVEARSVSRLTAEMETLVLAAITGKATEVDIPARFVELQAALDTALNQIDRDGIDTESQAVIDTESTETGMLAPENGLSDLSGLAPSKPIAPAEPSALGKAESITTTRVDSERLDVFMNLVGELIITRNSLGHVLNRFADQPVPSGMLQELKTVEGAINRISSSLQTALMDMRLIPVRNAFQKIPRIVRDIARRTGKKIQLQLIGEDTYIDKSIIEMIGDPLIHIVRNSCDHGIESGPVRLAAGKPETGSIVLKASRLRSNVVIEIIDDGAGLDTERIRRLAVSRGLISPEKAEMLDRKAVHHFIFSPGFTTAGEITEISGRGVGMDVVSTNIKKINGSVDIESTEGRGTQVTLLLPLTLAIINVLTVIDGGRKYAIPLDAIRETVEIQERDIRPVKQKQAINLRGEIIGVSRLSDLLETESLPVDDDRMRSVVLLQSGTRVIGLIVDDLDAQQEIVVKPLQRYLSNIIGINGSAILGDGEVILILDAMELLGLAAR